MRPYTITCVPTSTTRSLGMREYSVVSSARPASQMKSRPARAASPGPLAAHSDLGPELVKGRAAPTSSSRARRNACREFGLVEIVGLHPARAY